MPQTKGKTKGVIQKQPLRATINPNQPFVPPYTITPGAQQQTRPQLPQVQFPGVPAQQPTTPRVPTVSQEQMLGQTVTKPLPFMALGWTPKGEPYYGPEGPRAWGRKLFARIFDPEIYMEGKTYAEKQVWYDKFYANHPEVFKEDEYTKAIGVLSELEKQSPGLILKATAETIKAVPEAFFKLFRVSDYYSRKLYVTLKAEAEMADTYSAAPKEESPWEMMTRGFASGGQFGGAISPLPPQVAVKMMSFQQQNPLAAKNILNRNLASSEMIYSQALNEMRLDELGRLIWRDLSTGTPWAIRTAGAFAAGEENAMARKNLTDFLAGKTLRQGETLNKQFINRYNGGENPDFIVEDLMNPTSELVGSLLGDPMQWVFMGMGQAASKTARIASWSDDSLRVANEAVAKALELARKAPNDIEAMKAIEPVFTIMRDDILASKNGLEGLATKYGAFVPTSTAKSAILNRRMSNLFQFIVRGSTPEDAGAIFEAMILGGSADAGESLRALTYLSRTPFAPMFFSNAGKDSMALMSGFTDKMGGMNNLLKVVQGSESADVLLTEILPKWTGAIEDMYPKFSEMRRASYLVEKALNEGKLYKGEKITSTLKAWAAMYDGMSGGTKAWVTLINGIDKTTSLFYKLANSFFSWNYMGLSYGYAMRNLAQDSMAVMVEEGPRVAAQAVTENLVGRPIARLQNLFGNGSFHTRAQQQLIDIFGFLPEEAGKGLAAHSTEDVIKFGDVIKSEGWETAWKKITKSIPGGRTVASGFESGTSTVLWANAARREMTNSLASGFLPGADEIYAIFDKGGVPHDIVDAYIQMGIKDYWGDFEKANEAYRVTSARGILETFRLRRVPDNIGTMLEKLQLRQPFDDALKLSQTDVEFREAVEAGLDAIHDFAGKNLKAAPRVDANLATAYGLDQVDFAVREGMIPENAAETRLFHIRQQALNTSNQMYTNAAMQTFKDLDAQGVRVFEGQQTLLTAQQKFVGQVGTTSREYTAYLFDKETGLLSLVKGKTPEELTALWKSVRPYRYTLGTKETVIKLGDVPAGLTVDKFTNEIYRWWMDNTRHYWEKSGLAFSSACENAIRASTDQISGLTEQVFTSSRWVEADKARREMSIWYNVREWKDVAKLYGEDIVKMATERLPSATMADMDWNSLSFYGWKGGPERLVNAVNKDRRLAGLAEYVAEEGGDIYSQIPFSEAVQSVAKRLEGLGPPVPKNATPFLSQYVSEHEKTFAEGITKWMDDVSSHWGETKKVFNNQAIEDAMAEMVKITKPRLMQARVGAFAVAQQERNWVLHAYDDQTYFERFLAHIYLFPYWYGRTMLKWPVRLAENPQYLLAYAKYRRFLETMNTGLPDWWKYNLIVSRLPGMDLKSPMYFNVEQTLNPLYGITGVDYNDSVKRATAYARAADDMTKFGPSLYTPLNWIVAGLLYHEGKKEAGDRWLGRLIPFTATLKYVLYKMNIKTGVRYNDFDPFVQIFMGGLDPYEQAPIGRAAGAWVDEKIENAGTVTDARKEELYDMYSAQAQDAILARSGPLFEEFVARMASQKAPGRLTSFFLGQGFKTRTQTDLQIENFWNDYIALENGRDNMSPLEYRNMQAQLNRTYPWKDSVLLARLPDDERYRSFAYGVLARIAPGQQDEFFPYGNEAGPLGISGNMIDEFYDSKGDFSVWTPQDKERFVDGMVDLAALLAIPDYATQMEWNTAKDAYAQLKIKIALSLAEPYTIDPRTGEIRGQGVWDKVYYYYEIEDRGEADKYITAHPEVEKAMNLLTEGVMTDKMLTEYYGGLETIERYYTSKMYDELYKKFPSTDPKMENVGDEWNYYYDLKISGRNIQEDVLARTPGLQQYINLMDEKRDEMARLFPDMQTLWDTYDYAKWIGRITGDYSQADTYYDLNPKLKDYSDASKDYDRQIVGYLAQSMGLQAAIDLEALYNQYQNLATEVAYAYRDTHPEMDIYSDEKAKMIKNIAVQIGKLAKNLPEVPQVKVRPDFSPTGTTQLRLAALTQPKPKMSIDDYLKTYKISDETWKAVKRYFDRDKPLPPEVQDELDYVSDGNYMTLLFDLAAAYYSKP